MGELVQDGERIFEDQTTVFKLMEQMQYHHSSANNNRVFETPFLIRNREDLQQVLSALENLDVFEWARQQRPNSKWIVMDITNATFYVTKLRDHPIGRSTRLPKYVLETVNSKKTGTITRPPPLKPNHMAKLKAAIARTATKIHLL